MKYTLLVILSLFLLVSCGNDDDDNRFVNGVNAFGQQCSLNTINAYNGYNNFNNNYQQGFYNPYELELARRCGYALQNNFYNNGYGQQGFNNSFNNNNGCFVQRDLQDVAQGYNSIDGLQVEAFIEEIETELRDVHGIIEPLSDSDVDHYYTQVGFSAGVYTGGGYGYGNPYGGYGYGYCDQLNLL